MDIYTPACLCMICVRAVCARRCWQQARQFVPRAAALPSGNYYSLNALRCIVSHLFEHRPSASRVSCICEHSTCYDCKRSKRPVWIAFALSGGRLKLEKQIRC